MAVSDAEIVVEFYGTVRLRTGVDSVQVGVPTRGHSVGELLCLLADKFPLLGGSCISPAGELVAGFLLNVDGRRFTRCRDERIHPRQVVMLLSADVGG